MAGKRDAYRPFEPWRQVTLLQAFRPHDFATTSAWKPITHGCSDGWSRNLKVVHALGWYLPDSFGGTERYVDELARRLDSLNVVSEVLAARDGEHVDVYEFGGVAVTRYPVASGRTRAQLRGDVAHGGFSEFQRLLAGMAPDVYHQHSWTLGCGLHHLRAAVSLGIPAVLTIHVPGNICPNGTMMRGAAPCDGFLDSRRCSSCVLGSKGLARWPAALAASMPVIWSSRLSGMPGSPGSVMGARSMIEAHRHRLFEACRLATRVVVVAEWLRQSLLLNGVPPERITLSRHGVFSAPARPRQPRTPGPLRIGFLGRWDRVKGIDLLVRAIRRLDQSVPVELHVRALAQGQDGEDFRREVAELVEGDRRIQLRPPLPPGQVADFLGSIDVLAVPSQWMEAGPLVVLEALAVGTPVLGAALGGVKEWVVEGQNGWLVRHDDVREWSAVIVRLAAEGVGLTVDAPARSMKHVAAEMHTLYRELTRSEPGPPA